MNINEFEFKKSFGQNFIKDNNTYANTLNLGSIAGYAQYSTIKNWYGKVDLVEKEFSNATILNDGVGLKVVTSSGAPTNVIESEKVQTLSTSSNLGLNYGYEYKFLSKKRFAK